MTFTIRSENNGLIETHIHRYVMSDLIPSHMINGLYMGLTSPVSVYDKKSMEWVSSEAQTIIHFVTQYWTEDQRAFLPGEIIVATEQVDQFLELAAKWYLNEFELYMYGLKATGDNA